MLDIRPDEISVVVQGPVIGKPTDNHEQRLTFKCIESIRKHLPGAEIILSTWKDSNPGGLSYDILVENEDPGAVCYHYRLNLYNNVNRQIVSTRNGLLKASKKYALKIRSDMALTGRGFLNYFGKYTKRCEKWKVLKERVLICSVYSKNPRRIYPFPFHPSDWFFFGRREDVLNIWEIALAPEPETSKWFETRPRPVPDIFPHFQNRYLPEQYIWITFLRKYGNIEFGFMWEMGSDVIEASELTIANNLVILDPQQLQTKSLKHRLKLFDWASLYTYGEWLRMYRKYCDGSLALSPDIDLLLKKIYVVLSRLSGVSLFYSLLNRLLKANPDMLESWETRSPMTFRIVRTFYRRLF